VVPFVGSGLGVPVHLPSGPGLAKLLRERHPLAVGRQFPMPDNLIQVADELTSGGRQDREAVVEFIIEVLDLNKDPRPIPATFRHLIRIPSNLYVTTTYDLLPERAADAAGIAYRTFTWRDLPAPEEVFPFAEHSLYIVHLHGSVEDKDSLILDSKSYNAIAQTPAVEQFLSCLFTLFNVCFFGTALDEQYLAGWLLSWRRTRAHHVLVNDEAGIAASTQGRSPITPSMHGVFSEAFPSGRFDLLDGFCEDLVSRPASTSVPLKTAMTAPPPAAVADATLVSASTARYVTADWGPEWTRRALRELGVKHPDELEQLQKMLGIDDDQSVVVRLIRKPDDWMQGGSAFLWIAAARFAEQQGDWLLARDAWEQSALRAGADKVASLVSAAVACEIGGEADEGRKLLDRARAVDPQHPRVRLQDAGKEADPDKQLAELAELWNDPGDVGAIAHAQAAMTLLMQGKLDAAESHLEATRKVRPDMIQVRIVDANIRVHRGRLAMESGAHVNGPELESAKTECLRLRDELLAMRRFGESVRLLMLAGEATALQWELDEAGSLLLSATDEELKADLGRVILADAAQRAQQFGTVLRLLQGVPDSEVAVIRATALLGVGTDAQKHQALETLDEVIASRGEDALRAALVRATRAPDFFEAGWPKAAERVLVEEGLVEAASVSKAMWLHACGRKDEAVELLRQLDPNVRVVEVLMGMAILDGDAEEAGQVAADLLALGPDNRARLSCAEALFAIGEFGRAKAEATTVTNDVAATPYDLGRAYHLLGGIAADKQRDFQQALADFEKWAEVEPANERHIWTRLLMLVRLGRQGDALGLLESTHAFPVTMDDARLAASIYARMDDPIEAIRRVQQVIDRAPQHDEELERQLKLLALHRAGTAELPEDLAARVRPESLDELKLKAVSFDELREHAHERRKTQEQLLKGVMEGEVPTNSLAAVVQSDLGSVWMRFGARPYGFSFSELDVVERRDAQAAFDRGLVADPTAFFTIGDLGGKAEATALEILRARGRIAQATRDDLDSGVSSLLSELPDMNRQELSFDPQSGTPIPTEWPRDLVEADHRRARRMLELSQQVGIEPDLDVSRPTALDEMFDQGAPTALRSLLATAIVAVRSGLPVLSDDRCTRLLLRGVGIRAFGTVALLEELHSRGELTDAELQAARNRLRRSGYMGITATHAELTALVDAENGGCSHAVQTIVLDPAPWRSEYGSQILRIVNLLHHVFRNYREEFASWVLRLLATMEEVVELKRASDGPPASLRERLQWHAEWLLVATWMGAQAVDPATREFLKSMRTALDDAANALGASIDPLPIASRRFGALMTTAGAPLAGIPITVLAQMPICDVMRIVGVEPRARPPMRLPRWEGAATRADIDARIAQINQRASQHSRRGPRRR
jgi:tetratricopeptide (TPR) repeat protein